MPANRYRSRSYKRVYKNTPGGENVLRYKKKMPARIRHFLFVYLRFNISILYIFKFLHDLIAYLWCCK